MSETRHSVESVCDVFITERKENPDMTKEQAAERLGIKLSSVNVWLGKIKKEYPQLHAAIPKFPSKRKPPESVLLAKFVVADETEGDADESDADETAG